MQRRDFLGVLGGAAAWPVAARAQQPEQKRRIGVLQGGGDTDDPRAQPNTTAFLQALQQLGWTDGQNVKIDYRWPVGDADKARKYAAELVALSPDIILTFSAASLTPLLQATRTVPIVFVAVADPPGARASPAIESSDWDAKETTCASTGPLDKLLRFHPNVKGLILAEMDYRLTLL
ncbi:MAG: ABC transporter substrate binding protein, partial [Pseudolabrys sp.]